MGKFGIGVGVLAAIIPAVAAWQAMCGGLIKKASEQILGREIDAMEAWKYGLNKAWTMTLSGLLCFVVIIIGLILLIIPGLYLANRYVLMLQAVIIDDQGPWDALVKSKTLISGFWWRCFGIIFLVNLLMSIIMYIVEIPLDLAIFWGLGSNALTQILSNIIRMGIDFVIIPFGVIAFTLLYYDLKVRKENLDLKLMVDGLADNVAIPVGK